MSPNSLRVPKARDVLLVHALGEMSLADEAKVVLEGRFWRFDLLPRQLVLLKPLLPIDHMLLTEVLIVLSVVLVVP